MSWIISVPLADEREMTNISSERSANKDKKENSADGGKYLKTAYFSIMLQRICSKEGKKSDPRSAEGGYPETGKALVEAVLSDDQIRVVQEVRDCNREGEDVFMEVKSPDRLMRGNKACRPLNGIAGCERIMRG